MTSSSGSSMPTLRQLLARAHLRLILFTALLAGLTLTVTGVVIMQGYAGRNLTLIAQTVSYTIEPALLFDDRDAAREGIAMVAGSDGVRSVEIRDTRGRMMLQWSRADGSAMAGFERRIGAVFWPSPAIVPVMHGKTVLAEVRVFGAAGGIGRYMLSGLLIGLAGLGLTVMATRLLARRLQRDLIAPLARMAEVAHAVRKDRQFDRRAPAANIVEVDDLSKDFNALLDELQAWQEGMLTENRMLEQQAKHDALTGLSNRVVFERRLAMSIDDARNASLSFAVIYADVNRFKQVNDTYGHDAGDVMLIVIAARLRATLRPGDMAFRLGGDEFAIVLEAGTTRDEAEAMAGQITESMKQPIMLPSGDSILSSLSLGCALYPDDSADARDLMRHADAAMYAAKANRH